MTRIAALLALLLLVLGCAPAGAPESGPPVAVTSIGILADFVTQVGGDRVQVVALLPPGADPHTFDPTPKDARMVRDASIVFLNGTGLEPRNLETLIESNRRSGVPMIVLSDGLKPLASGDEDDGPGSGNPHFWLDPAFAIVYVERIADELGKMDPPNRATYAANAQRYVGELRELDRWIAGQIETIPPANRKLVTYHDAYAYFAQKYGLEQVGFVLRNPGREPSAADVASLVAKLRSSGVRTVYAEPQLNAKLLEVAAAEAGVKVGELYSDALDDRVKSYVEMMRFNTEQLVAGLR